LCGIAGLINSKGKREHGNRIKRAIMLQNERGNGLGAGFAVYGAYPEYRDQYALHVMAKDSKGLKLVEEFLHRDFNIIHGQDIPVWNFKINDHPFFRIFFVDPPAPGEKGREDRFTDDDYTLDRVMEVNARVEGVFIYSSGKDIGVFKGVGTPGDIYDFFRLDDYSGHTWLAHNRFPTNTPGWWGGAHPFNLLSYSIVHNGEISSYGTNVRYLESFGYRCTMQTDSEVVAYLLDLLIRKHGLPVEDAATVLAPPYWTSVEQEEEGDKKEKLLALKLIYESAMLNGPFAVLAAFDRGMFTLTDNTKLRPMTVGQRGDYSYFASEISALYEMEEELEQVYTPRAGEPCIITFDQQDNQADPIKTAAH